MELITEARLATFETNTLPAILSISQASYLIFYFWGAHPVRIRAPISLGPGLNFDSAQETHVVLGTEPGSGAYKRSTAPPVLFLWAPCLYLEIRY